MMFIGPWDQGGPWNSQGIEGITRFLNRAWTVVTEPTTYGRQDVGRKLPKHRCGAGRTGRSRRSAMIWSNFGFNTAIAAMMEMVNEMMRLRESGTSGGAAWNEA